MVLKTYILNVRLHHTSKMKNSFIVDDYEPAVKACFLDVLTVMN